MVIRLEDRMAHTARLSPQQISTKKRQTQNGGSRLRDVADELSQLYHKLRFTKVHFTHRSFDEFDQLTPQMRKYFEHAAMTCLQLDAEPIEFIRAQFDAFRKYGIARRARVTMMPMPHQLFGLSAAVRYAEYMEQRSADQYRDADHRQNDRVMKEHVREERKLQAMSRRLRRPESEVLAQVPSEFTPAFLQHKGVWTHVKDLYRQQMSA